MSKEATLTIRIEHELREDFAEAAKLAHRPGPQILRDFMRDFVDKTRETVSRTMTTPEEQAARREAVSFARASVGLEGFAIPEEVEKQAERFIRGEINLPAFVKVASGHSQER